MKLFEKGLKRCKITFDRHNILILSFQQLSAAFTGTKGSKSALKTSGSRISNNDGNEFARYVQECGLVDYVKQLEPDQSVDSKIYDTATSIIELYFPTENT